MTYNLEEIKAVREQLMQNQKLLDAYLDNTPLYAIAKQQGFFREEAEARLHALLKGHNWFFYKPFPRIDIPATGQNILAHLERRGILKSELQLYLGYASLETPYRWFEGKNLPSLENFYVISRILDTTINDLIVPKSA